jgi:aspartate-semialdehyde dehydrogenase
VDTFYFFHRIKESIFVSEIHKIQIEDLSKMTKKYKVGILGATGAVGQKFVQLLENHPWFDVSALAASERSAGNKYAEIVGWIAGTPIPKAVAKLTVQPCTPKLDCDFVFSGLDSKVAGEIETEFAKAGYPVISNSKNHRQDPDVPLLIPEINATHISMIKEQKYGSGFIVTNPNCSVIGLVMALKPIYDQWGLEAVNVVTMQALSGAGYPGVPSLDILDNVVPFIGGEEPKIEPETLKLLGKIVNNQFELANFKVSAQCNRVAVIDGHLECVNIKLKEKAAIQDIIDAWESYRAEPQEMALPFAPKQPIHYFHQEKHPQPRLHRNLENGMAASVGRLRECPILDYKFVVLSHNTVRGAAGCAILNAELLVKEGYLKQK